MPKVGVVLSGCGVFDGAEIHETVLTLYFLQKNGAETICMAPDIDQLHVVDHLKGEVAEGEKRNVLTEAARICRGDIRNLADVKVSDFDALIFPGGFGTAKNLTDFAVKGADCGINPEVLRIVRETVMAKKPLGAICIAPVVVAKALAGTGIKTSVTIGNDEGTAEAVETFGVTHVNCSAKDFVADEKNKIVSSPAYMLGQSIPEVAEGIEKTVKKLLAMI
jgi:enhancing lycopene biosynthesis protein 2